MFEKIRKLKDRKGFTLVELIVVLVILAILAALLIPALTGYIDKANGEKVVAETRMVVMAAQTEASSTYAKGPIDGTKNPVKVANVNTLAEVKALSAATPATYTVHVSADGKVLDALYVNGTMACFYDGTGYHVGLVSKNDGLTAPKENTITVATTAAANPVTTEL